MTITKMPRRILARAKTWAGTLFIVSLFLIAGGSAVMYAAVHHTAQPQFCNSCHLMEPYYESWKNSPHHDVACIDCHYEPGSLETLEGKFKALSQLAKYVTRTQGTKPWAEVSDASCMRSGCHSVRMLEGEVQFGNISFDHRHHLLESRRGRRLRCTSCHTGDAQGVHVAVASSVCITCHFMPGKDGRIPEHGSDCLTCHGPPKDPVLVEGRPFVHADYVERGVNCRECHNPVIEGNGTVRKERCHSCHAEVGHIEHMKETAFMHEKHVTEHKVECFECHDEMHHGLLPLKRPETSKHEGCGVCHESAHDAASMVFAGTGAAGVADEPSRMYQTRVVCEACHTGRSGYRLTASALAAEGAGNGAGAAAHKAGAHAPSVAAAGNVDCIHCHGTEYDGLLGQWQAAVGEQIDRLRPLLAELEPRVAAAPGGPAAAPLEEARRNVTLVALDGSRGAHNVSYALRALRAAAERIDTARELLGEPGQTKAVDGLPFVSKDDCTQCHAAAGRPATVWKGEAAFPHQRHLAEGLECSTCHSTTQHGEPAFPRTQCASCHHQESDKRDVTNCQSCHPTQVSMLAGKLEGFADKPGTMTSLECSQCHSDPPAILRPKPNMCVLCHEKGYDDMQREWQRVTDGLIAEVEKALAATEGSKAPAAAIAEARKALEIVRRDGTRGVHNHEMTKSLLEGAIAALSGK